MTLAVTPAAGVMVGIEAARKSWVGSEVAQTSASWLSEGFSQRQIVLQAAPGFGQPQPLSRVGGSGRPYRHTIDVHIAACPAGARPRAPRYWG